MARKLQWIGLAALSLGLTGCVTSTDKYNAMSLEKQALEQRLGEAQTQASTERARAEAYANQLKQMSGGGDAQMAMIANLQSQLDTQKSANADLQRRYEEMASRPPTGAGPLAPEVSGALTTFANQNPDLVDFDAARGMVKFKTDFTFALGSADLTDKAKSVISRFSQILNADAARSYELMVAGHTDSTPVSNPATKAKHPDNWYLSSHRAIAVGGELMKHGVSGQRVAVVGYGDQRPISTNAAQNRRVEVMILPSTVRTPVAKTGGSKPAVDHTTKKPTGGLNKDTVAPLDTRPILNK